MSPRRTGKANSQRQNEKNPLWLGLTTGAGGPAASARKVWAPRRSVAPVRFQSPPVPGPHLCRPQSPDLPSLFGTVRSAWAPEAARTGLSQAALGLRAPPRLPRPPSGEEPPYPEAEGARGSAPTPAASQVWVVPIYWKRRRLAAVDKTQTSLEENNFFPPVSDPTPGGRAS